MSRASTASSDVDPAEFLRARQEARQPDTARPAAEAAAGGSDADDSIVLDAAAPLRGGDGRRNDLEEGLLGAAAAGERLPVNLAYRPADTTWMVMVGGPHPIAHLERVKWLGWQLQGYGFSRAERRHHWLKDRCSCFVHEHPRASGGDRRRDECGCGRLLRWVLGLTWWSLFLLVAHLTYAIAEPAAMLFSSDNLLSNAMLAALGDLAPLDCPSHFREATEGAHLHPVHQPWPDDVKGCCVAECDAGNCLNESKEREDTCSSASGWHWKPFGADVNYENHPWTCCPDHAEGTSTILYILLSVLGCLLLVSRVLVLKIATPGGGGARAHPLSDAIDPFTLLAVSLEMVYPPNFMVAISHFLHIMLTYRAIGMVRLGR